MKKLLRTGALGMALLSIAAIAQGQNVQPEYVGALADERAPSPAPPPEDPAEEERLPTEAEARWERLQAQSRANTEAQRRAQERYEAGLRETADARARYEEDMARHRADVERAQAAEAAYREQLREHEAQTGGRRGSGGARRAAATPSRPAETSAPAPAQTAARGRQSCEDQRRRNRQRGWGVGRLIGTVAGAAGNQFTNAASRLARILPVAEFLVEAIATILDCDEQQQAASATEEAVQGGVGTTVAWASDTRPGVSGSSTVTAAAGGANGAECLTVTDIVIVDGEETRAPKQMCRTPPSTRYVRV